MFVFISQHYQWICLTTKRRAQDFPVEGFIASAQSQITQCLPSTGTCVHHETWIFMGRQITLTHDVQAAYLKTCFVFSVRTCCFLLLLFLIPAIRSHPPVSQAVFPFNLLAHTFKCLAASLVGFVCFAAGLLRGAVFREGQHSNRAGM